MITKTAQFTPGPWKAVPDKSRNMYTWYVEGAKGVVPTIARLSLIDACEEIESNAHLIAAAPAMYEALQIMVRAANVDEIDPLVMFASIERARHVLKLAEGKSA